MTSVVADAKLASVAYLGQERAVESLRFGIGLERDGYNMFVLGQPGSHRHALVKELAAARAREKATPDDWCYANNFTNPERPQALRLPAGKGAEFREDMHALIDEIRITIPTVFEEDDYRNQLKVLEAELQKDIKDQWEELRQKAAKVDIAVLQTPTGYVLAPVRDGKVVDDEEFEKLPKEDREAAFQTLLRRRPCRRAREPAHSQSASAEPRYLLSRLSAGALPIGP